MTFFSKSSAQLSIERTWGQSWRMKQPARNGQICKVRGLPRSGKRVCSSSWCFIGVHAKFPNSQVSHREVWDHHCQRASWDAEKQSTEKKTTQNLSTNPCGIASPWRNHFREICIHYWCPTDSVPELPCSTSFSHAETPMLIHFSLRYGTQLMLVKRFEICKRTFLGKGIVSPGFMMKTSVDREHCRT